MQLLLATNNSGKIQEMRSILSQVGYDVLGLSDVFSEIFDVEETGATFAANAELKAKAYAQEAGIWTLADDSGLSIAALDGKPGVYSKRFIAGSDHDRNIHVLKLLENVAERQAFFTSVMCLYNPATKQSQFFEGQVHGAIAHEERGTHGFGYDPIFIPTGYQQTFGELDAEIKNRISHRAKALESVHEYLS